MDNLFSQYFFINISISNFDIIRQNLKHLEITSIF